MSEQRLFIPLTKIDLAKRLIYGTVTEEVEDKDGEIWDYASSKPYVEEWSNEISKATGGSSLGNVRSMHGKIAAGKVTQLDLDDSEKRMSVVVKVVDDDEWEKCLEGVYTGFSQGGRYVRKWSDNLGKRRFTGQPYELSLVDNPNVRSAHFVLVKADGAEEPRQFKRAEPGQGKERVMDLRKFQGPENGTVEDVEKLIKDATDKAVKDTADENGVLRKKVADAKAEATEARAAAGDALNLQRDNEALKKSIADREEKDLKDHMKKVLDSAIKAGKFEAGERPKWEKRFRTMGAADCEDLLNKMQAVVPMNERIGAGGDDAKTLDEQCDEIITKIATDEKVSFDVAADRARKRNPKVFSQREEAQLQKNGRGGVAVGGFGSDD